MSERREAPKALEQDLFGIFFAGVGGFFAVSIVLALLGHEAGGGLLTAPVEELLVWLGPWAGLLLSTGLAVLGTLQFLSARVLPIARWLGATVAVALGLAFLCGTFANGGELGRVFPELVSGVAGRVLGAVLGVALLWTGLVLGSGALRPAAEGRRSPRIDLSPRAEVAGVSAAEAALLVTEPSARPLPLPVRPAQPARPAESAPARLVVAERPRETAVAPAPSPTRTPAVKPEPKKELPKSEVRPLAAAAPATRPAVEPQRPESAPARPVLASAEVETPPAPSWEQEESEDLEEELALGLDLDTEVEEDDDEEESLEDATPDVAPVAEESATPSAAWEQVGLFDEEEEEDEAEAEAPDVAPVALDESAADEEEPRAEQDEPAEDPFALDVAIAPAAPAARPAPRPQPMQAASTPAEPEFVIQPRPTPAPAARDEEAERWKRLVYDSGCLVLDQNRVAVSMLERRFGIDFDQACKILDELQGAGLIGPYMGGRTRDILLSRDEWLAHAPPS